ncbi:MAG TPA: DMT family transporter [Acidiphilium sp.]
MLFACGELALSMMLVGGNVVILKILASHLPVFVILALRTAIAALVAAPFARLPRVPPRRIFIWLLLQAILGTIGYNAFLLLGLARTGAVQAGLVLATLPAVIALGAAFALRERLARRHWFAVVLAVAGMGALAHGGSGFSIAGDALVFCAVCGEAAYALLARKVAGALPVLQATFWMQISGAVLCAPFAISQIGEVRMTAFIAILLVVHSLTSSLLAVLLWYRGMKRVPAGLGGAFTALLPATAAVCGILILGERFTRNDGIGFAALLTSMLLILWSRPRPADTVSAGIPPASAAMDQESQGVAGDRGAQRG